MSHENAGLRLAGEGYLRRTNLAGEQPVLGPLPMEYVGASPKTDRATVLDTRRATRGVPLHVVTDPQEPAGKLIILNVSRKVLAMLLLGSEVALSEVGGSVTDETHEYVADFGFQLDKGHVSNLALNSAAAGGGTAYVLDADYEILDAKEGIVRPISGGAMGAGGTVYASYDNGAISGQAVKMGGDATIEADVRFAATNDLASDDGTTGDDMRVHGRRMLLSPSGEINLAGKEAVKAEFDAIPLQPSTGEAFQVEWPTYA